MVVSQEAVDRLFQKALQYCDPLKLHLELLKLYERTEQHKLADELLEKMVKKFKQSSEVYLALKLALIEGGCSRPDV